MSTRPSFTTASSGDKKHIPSECPVRRTREVLNWLSAVCTAERMSVADLETEKISSSIPELSRTRLHRMRGYEALVRQNGKVEAGEQRRVEGQTHELNIAIREKRETRKLSSAPFSERATVPTLQTALFPGWTRRQSSRWDHTLRTLLTIRQRLPYSIPLGTRETYKTERRRHRHRTRWDGRKDLPGNLGHSSRRA